MSRKVVVLPYDPTWVELFKDESRLVLEALGENAMDAHHIGSTAISGTVAKPVIDILIVVANIDMVDAHNVAMEKLSYDAKGEYGIPTRRYFRKANHSGERTHHVHVFAKGNEQIERHLNFRDFMNAHPDWALEYSALKLALVATHRACNKRYVEGKNAFIEKVDRCAAAWRAGGRAN